jgi:regulator of replication initiation timing
VQTGVASIVPKPTKAQIIDAMVHQIVEQRLAENARREIEREKLQKKLDVEIERMKRMRIKFGDLDINWKHAGAMVYASGKSFDATPAMKTIHEQMKQFKPLSTYKPDVKEEVELKLKSEMMQAVLSQPGVKEGINSAIAKLGL